MGIAMAFDGMVILECTYRQTVLVEVYRSKKQL